MMRCVAWRLQTLKEWWAISLPSHVEDLVVCCHALHDQVEVQFFSCVPVDIRAGEPISGIPGSLAGLCLADDAGALWYERSVVCMN